MSTSLWGRELKFPSIQRCQISRCRPPCEVVSWNRPFMIWLSAEMVDLLVRSWVEISTLVPCFNTHESTSLWGRELKYINSCYHLFNLKGRPPCEVVSWNTIWRGVLYSNFSRPPCEVVSWNHFPFRCLEFFQVDLLVRSWVEMWYTYNANY